MSAPPITTTQANTGSYFVIHHEPMSAQMAKNGIARIGKRHF